MTTIVSVPLVAVTCTTCGAIYGLPPLFVRARQQDHATWYCPNGHGQHYPAPPAPTRGRGK